MAGGQCRRCGASADEGAGLSRYRKLCGPCGVFRVFEVILEAQRLPEGYCMANGQPSEQDLSDAIAKITGVVIGR